MSYQLGNSLHAENNDGVRGYSLETNDFLDNEDYFGVENNNMEYDADYIDGEGENDKAPEMPSDFYQQVETFLRKEPPKIGEIKDGKGKKKKKSSEEGAGGFQSQIPTLPPVAQPKAKAEHHPAEQKSSKRKSSGESKKQKSIDPQLLREAFAYTDNILRNAVLEEAVGTSLVEDNYDREARGHKGPAQKERKTNSAPSADMSNRDYLFYGAPSGKGKNAPVNVVRSLKSKKRASGSRPAHSEEFSIQKEEELDLKRNPLNFEELVSNFQSGMTLDRLRKELEDSQRSLKNSKSAIRDLMRK